MKIVKIQEKELNEARDLQKKCVDLHLPVPPVVSWNATIIDKDGIEREQTIAKANSYVRNALNLLSRYVGMVSSSVLTPNAFKDGLINLKGQDGTIQSISINNIHNATFNIYLGDSTSPTLETLDHYILPSITPNAWSSAGQLHYTNFDQDSRKLITQFIVVMVNTSPTVTRYISEAGVSMFVNYMNYLMLRDVFTPIAVEPGESIRFVYQTEVLYPL